MLPLADGEIVEREVAMRRRLAVVLLLAALAAALAAQSASAALGDVLGSALGLVVLAVGLMTLEGASRSAVQRVTVAHHHHRRRAA